MPSPTKISKNQSSCYHRNGKKNKISKEGVIDVVSSMYARAFGLRHFQQIKERQPIPILNKKYIEWMKVVEMVETSRKQSEPLEDSQEAKDLIQKLKMSEVNAGKVLASWKRLGINSHPNPLHEIPPNSPFYQDAIHAQKQIDSMVKALYHLSLYPQEKPHELSYTLLPLFNSIAVKYPSRNFSWYEVISLYGECVREAKTFSSTLLQSYPFLTAAQALPWSFPFRLQKDLPSMSLQQFTAKVTIQAMGYFFDHQIPERLEQELTACFLEDEKTRMDLIYFISDTYQELQKDKNYTLPEETYDLITQQNYSHLFLSSLMALRTKWTLFAEGTADPYNEVITWVFKSNRQFVLGLDALRFEKPYFFEAITIENYVDEYFLDPQQAIPIVLSLEPLYSSRASFNENALSLLIGLLPISTKLYDSISQTLLLWARYPLNRISSDQILDYLSQKDKKDFADMEALFEAFIPLIPERVQDPTGSFFSCIFKSAHVSNNEILRSIKAFNNLINGDDEPIDSTLYFSSLHTFVTGRLGESHFALISLYEDQYLFSVNETLAFLLRFIKNDHSPPLDAPAALLKSLSLASKIAEKDVQTTLAIYSKEVFKKKEIPQEDLKAFRLHALSKLPDQIKTSHCSECIQVVTSDCYQFSPSQTLYILHELLSLQDQDLFRQTINWVKWIEEEIQCSLDRETATYLLTYHPNSDLEGAKTTLSIPDSIELMADPVRDAELANDPVTGKNRLELLEKYLHCRARVFCSSTPILQICQNYPHGWVTKQQVMNHLISTKNCPSQETVKKLISVMPQNLIGRSPEFFTLVIHLHQDQTLFPKITSFNRYLDPSEENSIQTTTYFKTLKLYFAERVNNTHFEIFTRYPRISQENQLKLMIHALENFTPSRELRFDIALPNFSAEKVSTDLLRALYYTTISRALWIKQATKLFEKNILKRQLLFEEVLVLYCNPLRPLDHVLRDDHIQYSLSTSENLTHPFTVSERLYLFYHLLSLQENQQGMINRIKLIRILEQVQGHRMGSKLATLLITHDQIINYQNLMRLLTQFLQIRQQLAMRYLESFSLPLTIYVSLDRSICNMMKELQLNQRPDLAEAMNSFFRATSIYQPIDYVIGSIPAKLKEQTLVFFPFSVNHAVLPLRSSVDLKKSWVTSWEVQKGNIQVTISIIATNTYTSYSHVALLPLSIENWHTLESFFTLLTKTVHMGFDRSGETSFPIETFDDFKNHPTISSEIQQLPYRESDSILNALYTFLLSFRTGQRTINLALSSDNNTPSTKNLGELFKPEKLPLLASAGYIFPLKNGHTMIPKKFLKGMQQTTLFYSSIQEMQELKISEILGECENMKALFKIALLQGEKYLLSFISSYTKYTSQLKVTITANLVEAIEIDTMLEIKPTLVSLRNTQDQENSFDKHPALEVSLQGTFIEEDVQLTKIHLLEEFAELDKIKMILSWELASFKQKLYGRIRDLLEFKNALEKGYSSSLFFTLPELSYGIIISATAPQTISANLSQKRCTLKTTYQLPSHRIVLEENLLLSFFQNMPSLIKTLQTSLNNMRIKITPSDDESLVEGKKEKLHQIVSDKTDLKALLTKDILPN